MQYDNVIPLVKKAMLEHEEDLGPFLDDKDYEQWFVKYYLHFSKIVSSHPTSATNKRSKRHSPTWEWNSK
jgi:hypothetical protein